ncbi:hypothetical protein CO653_10630 [Rhizobium anhuiense]|nr:hypothetical protein CO653_10630 [Rhizobium anhuiense]
MLEDNVAAARWPMQQRESASTEKLDTRTSRSKDSLNDQQVTNCTPGRRRGRIMQSEFIEFSRI